MGTKPSSSGVHRHRCSWRKEIAMAPAHRQLIKLRSVAEHTQQRREVGRPLVHVVQLRVQQRDARVLEVVVRRDAAEGRRPKRVALRLHLDAARVLEVDHHAVNETREEIVL